MEDKSLDTMELKKQILLPHLPFVEKMLIRFKGTPYEDKYVIMHKCISNENKRMTYQQIQAMKKAILDLEQKLNFQKECERDTREKSIERKYKSFNRFSSTSHTFKRDDNTKKYDSHQSYRSDYKSSSYYHKKNDFDGHRYESFQQRGSPKHMYSSKFESKHKSQRFESKHDSYVDRKRNKNLYYSRRRSGSASLKNSSEFKQRSQEKDLTNKSKKQCVVDKHYENNTNKSYDEEFRNEMPQSIKSELNKEVRNIQKSKVLKTYDQEIKRKDLILNKIIDETKEISKRVDKDTNSDIKSQSYNVTNFEIAMKSTEIPQSNIDTNTDGEKNVVTDTLDNLLDTPKNFENSIESEEINNVKDNDISEECLKTQPNDISTVLKNISTDDETEYVLKNLHEALGSENLLKIQNLLLKDVIKKTTLEVDKNFKTENELSSYQEQQLSKEAFEKQDKDEITHVCKKTRKKMGELDKLHLDISKNMNSDEIIQTSMQPRRCTTVMKSVDYRKNINDDIKPCSVMLLKLNLSLDDMPVILNEEFEKNHGLDIKKMDLLLDMEAEELQLYDKEEVVEDFIEIKKEKKLEPLVMRTFQNETSKRKISMCLEEKEFEAERKKIKQDECAVNEWVDITPKREKHLKFKRTMQLNEFRKLFDIFSEEYQNKQKRGKKKKSRRLTQDKRKISKEDSEIDESNESMIKCDDLKISSNVKKEEENQRVKLEISEPVINLDVSEQTCSKYLNFPPVNETNKLSREKYEDDKLKKSHQPKIFVVVKPFQSLVANETKQEEKNSGDKPIIDSTISKIFSQSDSLKSSFSAKSFNSEANNSIIKSLTPKITPTIIKNVCTTLGNENLTSTSINIIAKNVEQEHPNNLYCSEAVSSNKKDDFSQVVSLQRSKLSVQKLSMGKISPGTSKHPIQFANLQMSNVQCLNSSSNVKLNIKNYSLCVSREEKKSVQPVINNIIATQITGDEQNTRVEKIKIILPESVANNEETIEVDDDVIDISDEEEDNNIVDVLRPWIQDSNYKSKKCTKASKLMLKDKFCLAALYKCMATTCCFFTSEKNYFQIHLELHRDHQKNDMKNYLLCSYCEFRGNDIVKLIAHINNKHGCTSFSCSNCFYRSVNDFQIVENHHSKYHKEELNEILVFAPNFKKEKDHDFKLVKASLPKFCEPLTCVFCSLNIYTISEFKNHINKHEKIELSKCLQCNEITDASNILAHYFNCYGYGLYQCAYCNFGTALISSVDNHYYHSHPECLPYFIERTLSSSKMNKVKPIDVKSVTIKLLSKKDFGKFIKRVINKGNLLQNSENMGNLSNKIVKYELEGSFNDDCPLIIQNVTSLNTKDSIK